MFDEQIASAVRALDGLAADARQARGDRRAAIVERLAALDRAVIEVAIAELAADTRAELRGEAERELAAFGARMAPEAKARAVEAAFDNVRLNVRIGNRPAEERAVNGEIRGNHAPDGDIEVARRP